MTAYPTEQNPLHETQLKEFNEIHGHILDFKSKYLGELPCEYLDNEDIKDIDHWHISLHNKKNHKTFTSIFHTGPALRKNGLPEEPCLYDVLSAIQVTDTHGEDFETWARNLGHNPDSIKGLNRYLDCQKETKAFHDTFPNLNLLNHAPLRAYA